ncbi:hypothetical protein FRB94_000583 [Tulasnella sp. JGI-2019a]|nr:hypothetical protein FRB93_013733 [Tulasnella sp. JGI-2019a]KAG9006566.1 hypothetical protein FRB94_000583 [Tulasnella sp. JGI-2019a]
MYLKVPYLDLVSRSDPSKDAKDRAADVACNVKPSSLQTHFRDDSDERNNKLSMIIRHEFKEAMFEVAYHNLDVQSFPVPTTTGLATEPPVAKEYA